MTIEFGYEKHGDVSTVYVKSDDVKPYEAGKLLKCGQRWRVILPDGGRSKTYQNRHSASCALIGIGMEPESEQHAAPKNYYYRIVKDPSKYPLRSGMRLSKDEIEAGLRNGTFAPQTTIKNGDALYKVRGAWGKKQQLVTVAERI